MQYALDRFLNRIEPDPGATACCPCCATPVIAKCGDQVIHHWAHESLTECDSWWEPESAWHRSWKLKFPENEREVVIGSHRADVFHKGVVVEFQKSPISISHAIEREDFYRQMIWLFFQRWKTTELKQNQYGFYFYAPRMARILTCLKARVLIHSPDDDARPFVVTKIRGPYVNGWFLNRHISTELEWLCRKRELPERYLDSPMGAI